MNVRKNINNVLNPFLIFWMWRNRLKNRNINKLKWVYQASKHIVCYSVPTLNYYWEKEDYKSNKYENIYAHKSWTNRPHTSNPPTPTNTCTHTPSLSPSLSVSLYTPAVSSPFFGKMIWGTQMLHFTGQWWAERGWIGVLYRCPLLLKTPELLSPTQQLNSHEKEQHRRSAASPTPD